MKSKFLFTIMMTALVSVASAQEYKVVTTVESIIPAGIGRSRMISPIQEVDTDLYTTERTNGKKGGAQGQVKRKALKIDNFEETKMLNFFSVTGINFQNIASNDAMISDKLSSMAEEGWELAFVTSGVESDSGVDDGQGIYITRYVFKR
ncbi:MAG: hypothetical protein AAGC88_01375 [Bacteroidota bacterium]